MAVNGRLESSQLVAVEGQFLSPSTAAAYRALRDAARHQKHSVSIWTPSGAYRDQRTQQLMHDRPQDFNIKPGVVLAAVGKSTHGQGRAVDIQAATVTGRKWVQTNAHKFGFSRPMPKTDPDHYELGRNVVTVTDPTPAPTPTPSPIPEEQIPMTSAVFYQGDTSGKIYARQDPFAHPDTRDSWMQFVDPVTWKVLIGNHNAAGIVEEGYLVQSIAEFGLIGAGRFRRNQATGEIWGQGSPGEPFALLTPAQWTTAQAAGGVYKDVPAAQIGAATTVRTPATVTASADAAALARIESAVTSIKIPTTITGKLG